jgi:hypothetical protein
MLLVCFFVVIFKDEDEHAYQKHGYMYMFVSFSCLSVIITLLVNIAKDSS